MIKEEVSRLNYSDFQETVSQNFFLRRNWNKGRDKHNGIMSFDEKMQREGTNTSFSFLVFNLTYILS